MMFYYGYDRSMSFQRTLLYFAIAIALIAASALIIGKWSILTGVIWFVMRLCSPNRVERALAFAMLSIVISVGAFL